MLWSCTVWARSKNTCNKSIHTYREYWDEIKTANPCCFDSSSSSNITCEGQNLPVSFFFCNVVKIHLNKKYFFCCSKWNIRKSVELSVDVFQGNWIRRTNLSSQLSPSAYGPVHILVSGLGHEPWIKVKENTTHFRDFNLYDTWYYELKLKESKVRNFFI